MNLDLKDLRALLALADHGHFGRAAEALHVSQPALSKQVRRMEERIGGPLLLRSTRRLDWTPAGRVLQERARGILAAAESAEELSRLALAGEAGLLRVGCGLASLTSGLPEVLRRFRKRHPGVHVIVRDMSSDAQLRALVQGELDVAFLRLPARPDGVHVTPVIEERLLTVRSTDDSSPGRDGLAAFRESPFVVCSRATSASYYDHVIRTCAAAGFTPRVVQETNQVFAALHLVRAGIGVSLVPSSARRMRVPGLRFGETKVDEARWSVGMAVRSADRDLPLAQNFFGVAKGVFASG